MIEKIFQIIYDFPWYIKLVLGIYVIGFVFAYMILGCHCDNTDHMGKTILLSIVWPISVPIIYKRLEE